MSNPKITTATKSLAANVFLADVTTGTTYIAVGKSIPFEPDDSTVPNPLNSVQGMIRDSYDNMIYGKRIASNDAIRSIKRIPWTNGVVYEQYDDQVIDLETKNFFVFTSSEANKHIYKCLFNNYGAGSTIQPSLQDSSPFQTADGYIWKYMATIDSATFTKFGTPTTIPLVANSQVTNASINGSIETVVVNIGGAGYDNYFEGTFRGTDLRLDGNPLLYSLLETASPVNDFYENCLLKITSGAGAGQYRRIVSYQIISGRKQVFLASAFTVTPSATDTYVVLPAVIFDNLSSSITVECQAHAIINTVSNSVIGVEVLNPGSGYREAPCSIIVSNSVPVTIEASLRAIISPPNGHGSDVFAELYSDTVTISKSFSNNESGTFPTNNDFRYVTLLSNVKYANVTIATQSSNTVGSFVINENIIAANLINLKGTATVNTTSVVVLGTNTNFTDSLTAGDIVILTNGAATRISTVASVTNATYFSTSSNNTFNGTAEVSLVDNATFVGALDSNDVGVLNLSNVNPRAITSRTSLIGQSTGTFTKVDFNAVIPIDINTRANQTFSDFSQLTRVVGTVESGGEFDIDEAVEIRNNIGLVIGTAYVYYFEEGGATDIVSLTALSGLVPVGGVVVGMSSGAVMSIASVIIPDLINDSGYVIYKENITPVSRANNAAEVIKLNIGF